MDVYVLDGQLRRTEIIDLYESFIWTERFTTWGDFELVIRSTRGNRSLLQLGTLLAIDKSYRIMRVETVENSLDNEGIRVLKVTGRSFESLLEDRVAIVGFAGLTLFDKHRSALAPAELIRFFFDKYCVKATLNPRDTIPFYTTGRLLPSGTIPEPVGPPRTDALGHWYDAGGLYEIIHKIAEQWRVGFRFVRNGDTSQVYFETYTGYDRTSAQNNNTPVIFSTELENLTNSNEIVSYADYKNCVYIQAKNAAMTVYAEGVPATVSGLDRRVMYVRAEDLDQPSSFELIELMTERAREKLAEQRPVQAFDGEIPQRSVYKYQRDYRLGDLVERRNVDGFTTVMRVTEQIFVSDAEGERDYPSLTAEFDVFPATWGSWPFNETWENADGFWEDV